MQKLFVSFTSLLGLVSQGKVSQADLDTGLFFFGCWREHALNPGAAGEPDERSWDGGKHAHAHAPIVAALLRAEQDGRVAWHNGPNKSGNPWRKLDDLLADNGFRVLHVQHDTSCHYGYPAVKAAVAEKGLELDVLY